MPSKTPAGGALPKRTRRGLVVALVVWVFLAIVMPISVDASTGGGSPTPAKAVSIAFDRSR